ncbi:MAG TPA: transporter [Thermodesulfobacteriota bacterium]|nr:transporter [Thermodesulfobacteriota bacterium]
MKTLLLSLCCLLIFPCLSLAAPPLLISDTGTPGDGHYELNAGISGVTALSGSKVAFPALDLNYGWGEHIQIKFELPWIFANKNGEEAQNGLGNSVLGVKWRFLDEDKHGLAMSVYPQLEFNTAKSSADKGLVDFGTKWILPMEVEKKFGPINVLGEVGFIYNPENGNQWLYGLALGYPTSKQFEWVGEIYGVAGSNFDWASHDLVFNVGFRWNLVKWLNWNTSVGRSLHAMNGDEKTFQFYTGVQFVF